MDPTRGVSLAERGWEHAFGWKRRREARRTLERFGRELKTGGRVLDLGCGRGYTAHLLEQEWKCDVICCDVVLSTVHAAGRFAIFDGTRLPFRTHTFDAVLMAFVLHHAAHPINLLNEVRRVSRGPVLVVEDTPQWITDALWGRWHTRSFSRRTGIRWRGKVRRDAGWRRLFGRAGLLVRRAERLERWERLPPISRTAFVLEPTS
ncbi:MAG TPA: class I SAM-dependent methyltransferase [Longimicrobiales bacterium]|nr:class I SAM-dependent methyltransferase [Longimicrobiales bacterium]